MTAPPVFKMFNKIHYIATEEKSNGLRRIDQSDPGCESAEKQDRFSSSCVIYKKPGEILCKAAFHLREKNCMCDGICDCFVVKSHCKSKSHDFQKKRGFCVKPICNDPAKPAASEPALMFKIARRTILLPPRRSSGYKKTQILSGRSFIAKHNRNLPAIVPFKEESSSIIEAGRNNLA